MSHRTRRPFAAALIAVMAASTFALALPAAHAEDAGDADAGADAREASKVLLILDASGSMLDDDPSGVSKMEAARTAMQGAIEALPDTAQVGLRVFGPTPTNVADECLRSELVHPVGQLDRAGLAKAVKGFSPDGATPIAYSLEEGAKDLGTDGSRHIILVSDGEENCAPDPCEAAKNLDDAGVTLQVDAVGFAVDEKTREQLRCIADATGGTYYDAKDAAALESSLTRLSTRAIRPFSVRGTPVEGTPQAAGAPELEAWQYTDRIVTSSQGTSSRFYRIARTVDGSTLRVGIVGREPYGKGIEGISRGAWGYELTTADGETVCDSSWETLGDLTGVGDLVTATVTALPVDPRVAEPDEKAVACGEAHGFLLEIRPGDSDVALDIPIELRVIEEPPATNESELPPGVAEVPKDQKDVASPASGTPERVVAGTSFNDALELPPGTYEVELVPGEMAFVKTPIDWGQSAVFAVDGPDPSAPTLQGLGMNDYILVTGNVYAPDTGQIDSQETWKGEHFHGGEFEEAIVNVVPEVRYRNRWDSPEMYFDKNRGFAMAGDYYFAVGINQDVDELAGQAIPVRFSFAVEGEPSGVPEFAGDTGLPKGEAAPEQAEAGSPLPVIGGALVAAGLLGGGAYLLWRRRDRESRDV